MSERWAQIKCAGCGAKNRVNLDRGGNAVCGRCQGVLLEVPSDAGGKPGVDTRVPLAGSSQFRFRLPEVPIPSPRWARRLAGTLGVLIALPVAVALALRIPAFDNYWNEVAQPGVKELYWRTFHPSPPIRLTGDRINGRLPRRPFPDDNPWNQRIDHLPVDPLSDDIINRTGAQTRIRADFGASYHGRPWGIPYIVVGGDTPKVPIHYTAYRGESDPGPFPIPSDAPIEGAEHKGEGDRHLIVVDRDNWRVFELFRAFPTGEGYNADSGATWDLKSNALRPEGWTSADAAGLPILPGLVRYDEVVEQGAIRHALRFTVERSRQAHVFPARHHASPRRDASFPPMGMRVRLRADYDISGFPPHARVILTALKQYGMFLADNGGNWFITGTPDPRWNDNQLRSLRRIMGRDLEVVKMTEIRQGAAPPARTAPAAPAARATPPAVPPATSPAVPPQAPPAIPDAPMQQIPGPRSLPTEI